MSKVLCIYHGNCDDGFAAAWVVRHALGAGNVEFYPGVYQQEPPDVRDREVMMVDFCYKRPVMEGIAKSARSLLVIDHHKTALAEIESFYLGAKPNRTWAEWHGLLKSRDEAGMGKFTAADNGTVASMFDMSRSGAGLSWDFFMPGKPRPMFINYIEDRDLWRKALPNGDEFTIALRSYPQDFEQWDELFGPRPGESRENSAQSLINAGYAIQRYYRLRIEEIKREAYRATFAPVHAQPLQPVGMFANAPYFASSEVAGELCSDTVPFGACFRQNKAGGWDYSLRSRGDFDVSELAKRFGGGGHKNAAGFSASSIVHVAV